MFTNVYKSKKIQKIEDTILDKINEWKEQQFKDIVGKSKITLFIRNYKHVKITKFYYDWSEDFVDEDNGEVIAIDRTTLVKIEKLYVGNKRPIIQIFNNRGKEIKFKI